MSSNERWYFTKEQLENSPSRRCGIDADKELSQRQQAANFIQDMGQRLQVTQLCINTAIVYMHRFYCFHSFTLFHRNAIASAALFLAAKVEEQPRKLEHIIKVAQMCLQKGQPNPDRRPEMYAEQAQELVVNENILLMTLGFDVAIEHPHAFIVKFCHIANASKDLSQTSYFMASNSLHLTTMCLQYKPTVVACFCIHLVCKWSNWQIPKSKDNLPWYTYVDPTVTEELLEQLTNEFLVIFDKCPSRLKKKIQNTQLSTQNSSMSSYPFDVDLRKQTNGGQQQAAGPSRNLFPPEMKKLTNAVAASGHHQPLHSPAKPLPAATPIVNGTVAVSGKLPNVLPPTRPSVGQTTGSSHHGHKNYVSHSAGKPRNAPVTKESTARAPVVTASPAPDVRIKAEVKQEPGATANHKSGYKRTENSAVETNGRTGGEVPGFGFTSHCDIISNVVKEVVMAKQNEKRQVMKEEPVEEKPFSAGGEPATPCVAKSSKSHSIFSPSPVGPGDGGKSSPTHGKIGDGTLPESKKEPVPVSVKLEPGTDYEDILRMNTAKAMTTGATTVPVPSLNNISVKEEPADPYGYVKPETAQLPPATVEHHRAEKMEPSECSSSHSHKKKKKHKEKDKHHDKEKRHKEKKRHKEDKHRHRKERSPEKEVLKEPGPIKITIPKEKLIDIPMKLTIKINKDQVVPPVLTSIERTLEPASDFRLKISKDKLKSRKRHRESDVEEPSKRFVYDNTSSSHNGFKDH